MKTSLPNVALALALAGVAVLVAPLSATAQATKAGWWMRVDTKKTEATAIALQIGLSKQDRKSWKTWQAGQPAEFDVPGDFSQAAELYVHASAIPDDEDVWFCIHYKGNGVRRFDFDTQQDAAMKRSDTDSECS